MSSVMAFVIPYILSRFFFVVVLDRMINLVPVTLSWPEVDHILLLFFKHLQQLVCFFSSFIPLLFSPLIKLAQGF